MLAVNATTPILLYSDAGVHKNHCYEHHYYRTPSSPRRLWLLASPADKPPLVVLFQVYTRAVLIHRSTACVRTTAHIFRSVSACPLRSPICVHATVQSAAIKSDSGRRNICKTFPRFLLAFIRSPRRRRFPDAVIYVPLVRYQPSINVSLREHVRYQMSINVSLRELVRQSTRICVCDCAICVAAIMRCGGNLIRYLFPDRRAISYRAHDRFGGPDYAKSNFSI